MTQKTRGTWKNYEAEVVKIWGESRARGIFSEKWVASGNSRNMKPLGYCANEVWCTGGKLEKVCTIIISKVLDGLVELV